MSGKIKSIGILAGEGTLPHLLVDACINKNIVPNLVRFKACQYDTFPDIPTLDTRIEQVGKIFEFFKNNDVTHVVMIGNLRRPSLKQLRPDFKGIRTLAKIGAAFAMGDDNLLRSLRLEIEREGFQVCGVDAFVDGLTLAPDVYTKSKPKIDLNIGLRESLRHGADDKGQSVLMHDNGAFSYEDRSGTSALIRRHGQKGSVLFKTMKPQQDPDLDRPTIGLDTFKALHDNQCAGIVIQANAVFVVDREACIQYANENGLFLEAINVE